MAKMIKLRDEEKNAIREALEKALENVKLSDGKIAFSKTFSSIDEKATLCFSELAWYKMQALIQNFASEVGWHGIAFRSNEEQNEYTITDIIVYPQTVTSVTVDTDEGEYGTWLYEQEDEVFDNLKMHGHSHVNMSVSPSPTDEKFYKSILDQLDDNMFYIFVIWNKRNEKTIKIYDMKKNILFETSDVTVKVLDSGIGIHSVIAEAKDKLRTPPPRPATYTVSKPSQPSAEKKTEPEKKPETKSETAKTSKSSGLRKGKRRDKDSDVIPLTGGSYMTKSSYYDYLDDDDPYGPYGYYNGYYGGGMK